MIVIDAYTVVGAALRQGSVPWQALIRARELDMVAMSEPVAAEIREVLARPKFARVLNDARRATIEALLFSDAHWFAATKLVSDCRDAVDNIYLELAWAARASVLVSSDNDLLVLHPWRGISVLRPAEFIHRPE